jgi:hypothetical protein
MFSIFDEQVDTAANTLLHSGMLSFDGFLLL